MIRSLRFRLPQSTQSSNSSPLFISSCIHMTFHSSACRVASGRSELPAQPGLVNGGTVEDRSLKQTVESPREHNPEKLGQQNTNEVAFNKPARTEESLQQQESNPCGPQLSFIEKLDQQMKQRKPITTLDYMSPTQSKLADVMLSGRLQPNGAVQQNMMSLPELKYPRLPCGHHLLYFPPFDRPDQLLPDGTQPLHHPGPPFTRRMWAGGKVEFAHSQSRRMLVHGQPAICSENVAAARWTFQAESHVVPMQITSWAEKMLTQKPRTGLVKNLQLDKGSSADETGPDTKDKVFVDVVKRYTPVILNERGGKINYVALGRPPITETITLVFLKDTPDAPRSTSTDNVNEEGSDVASNPPTQASQEKVVSTQKTRATLNTRRSNVLSVPFTATRSDLFRFSALTYNAHSIHLDRESARAEGHKNILVHGPLTLLLMLRLVAQHCGDENIESIEYRNLAPIEADEEMLICASPFKAPAEDDDLSHSQNPMPQEQQQQTFKQLLQQQAQAQSSDEIAKGVLKSQQSTQWTPLANTLTVWIQRARDNRLCVRATVQLFPYATSSTGTRRPKVKYVATRSAFSFARPLALDDTLQDERHVVLTPFSQIATTHTSTHLARS